MTTNGLPEQGGLRRPRTACLSRVVCVTTDGLPEQGGLRRPRTKRFEVTSNGAWQSSKSSVDPEKTSKSEDLTAPGCPAIVCTSPAVLDDMG